MLYKSLISYTAVAKSGDNRLREFSNNSIKARAECTNFLGRKNRKFTKTMLLKSVLQTHAPAVLVLTGEAGVGLGDHGDGGL